MLETVAAELGMDEPKKKSIPFMQRYLLQKKGNTDLFAFYEQLHQMIDKIKAKSSSESANSGQKFGCMPLGKVTQNGAGASMIILSVSVGKNWKI